MSESLLDVSDLRVDFRHDRQVVRAVAVSYTHLTLPTN